MACIDSAGRSGAHLRRKPWPGAVCPPFSDLEFLFHGLEHSVAILNFRSAPDACTDSAQLIECVLTVRLIVRHDPLPPIRLKSTVSTQQADTSAALASARLVAEKASRVTIRLDRHDDGVGDFTPLSLLQSCSTSLIITETSSLVNSLALP
jgi:hypothetical protein